MGFIYKIINKITNQYYIGQTMQNIEERWRQHKSSKSNCRYLKNSFQKYGIENFEFKLICICFDEDLNRLEIDYIKKYDSLVPKGFNLRAGGENGGKQNNETKIKISETLKRRYSELKPKLGKPHTEDAKNKISKALKGRKLTPEIIEKMKKNIIKRNVLQLDLNLNIINIFCGISEAANFVETTKNNISMACCGKRKTAKGFIWKYE
jgi:group I intron endonuclease